MDRRKRNDRRARTDTERRLSVGKSFIIELYGCPAELLGARERVEQAVKRAGAGVQLEVSGGITLENIRDYAITGVDFISVGALTHSALSVDIAFEVEADGSS